MFCWQFWQLVLCGFFTPAAKPAAKAEAVDEPVKRAVKKTESKDVASVLDAWADDGDE